MASDLGVQVEKKKKLTNKEWLETHTESYLYENWVQVHSKSDLFHQTSCETTAFRIAQEELGHSFDLFANMRAVSTRPSTDRVFHVCWGDMKSPGDFEHMVTVVDGVPMGSFFGLFGPKRLDTETEGMSQELLDLFPTPYFIVYSKAT